MSIIAIFAIIFGIVCCFWGYRIFKVILGILGFVLGAFLAGNIAFYVSGGNLVITVVAAMLGGLIGGALIVVLYFVGLFLLGAWCGILLVNVTTSAYSFHLYTVLFVLIAIIGGILAVVFQKLIIILSTAFLGSWYFISGLFYLLLGGGFTPFDLFYHPGRLLKYQGPQYYIVLLFWFILGIAGIVFQYRFTRMKQT